MKQKIYLIIIIWLNLFYATSTQAQSVQIEWQHCYGSSEDDDAYSIYQTEDGGFVVAGYAGKADHDVSVNQGYHDCWILELNESGILGWEKTFGGSSMETAKMICPTSDGGMIFVGTTQSNDGDVENNHGLIDIYVMKINDSGDIIWSNTIGGKFKDESTAIVPTHDGDYMVVGSSISNDGDIEANIGEFDAIVIKLSQDGEIKWIKNYGGLSNDYGYNIIQTKDGNFLIVGAEDCSNVEENEDLDALFIKINPEGEVLWKKTYHNRLSDLIMSVKELPEGGFIAFGTTNRVSSEFFALPSKDFCTWKNRDDNSNFFIIKLDEQGEEIWRKSYGGSESDVGAAIICTSDNGFLVSGFTNSNDGDVSGNHGNRDGWVAKLDAEGEIEWSKCFIGYEDDIIHDILQVSDYQYIVLGHSDYISGIESCKGLSRNVYVAKIKVCDIFEANLSDVDCDDNGTSSSNDDKVLFSLNPEGNPALGEMYQVTSDVSIITPSTAYYGSATQFEMEPGTASNGNPITILITDLSNEGCSKEVIIENPGACSSEDCVADFSMSISSACLGDAIDFDASNSQPTEENTILTYQWDMGNGITFEKENPTLNYVYENSGNYSIKLTITDTYGCMVTQEKNCTINPILPVSISIEKDVSSDVICENQPITFTANPQHEGDSPVYQWYLNGEEVGENSSTFQGYHFQNHNEIYCQLTSSVACPENNPATSDIIAIQVFPNLEVTMEIEVKPQENITLHTEVTFTAIAENEGENPEYIWSIDGVEKQRGTSNVFKTNELKNHQVVTCRLISSHLCTVENEVEKSVSVKINDIVEISEDIYFPNAFTPNGDGLNDEFKPVGNVNILSKYELLIYDRWGNKVFESKDPNIGWNGINGNIKYPEGNYVFKVFYDLEIDGHSFPGKIKKGNILLLK